MNLAVNTPKGQRISAIEADLLAFLRAEHPDVSLSHTPTNGAAFVDVVTTSANQVTGVIEIKVRFDSLAQIVSWGGYLFSAHKINQLSHASKLLGVPSYLLVYFYGEGECLLCPVSNAAGQLVVDFSRQQRTTQDTINGGTKVDDVAIIPLEFFRDLQPTDFCHKDS